MPASSAAWMMRIDSSWSVLPHSPNIIAPRHSGLTLTPVLPKLRSCMAADLVDRGEPSLEAVARRAQIQAPHTCALRTGQARGFVDVVVQPPRPVAQRLGVVIAEPLDVVDLEAGAFERERHAAEMQRVGIGEDVTLAERARFRIAVTQPGDAVVQHTPPVDNERAELLCIDVDLLLADVLNHADAGDCVERLAGDLPVVLHADVHLVADALGFCP